MATYLDVLLFSLLGGVVSLIGGIVLIRKQSSAQKLAKYATPFAAGALLAAVFLDLLHEGIETTEPYTVLMAALVGVVVFFFAERFLHWFHHHHVDEKSKVDPSASLVIVGDTMHNILDGVAIAASFLISVPTGIVTTIAVAAHEIPQEIGDFGLLLNKGLSRKKVLIVNILSALATTVAALITFALGTGEVLPLGLLLGLSAGFLLYIAMSDIIPDIHENTPKKRFLDWQPLMLLFGVVLVAITVNFAHKYIDPEHNHDETEKQVQMSGQKSDWACTYFYDESGTTLDWEPCNSERASENEALTAGKEGDYCTWYFDENGVNQVGEECVESHSSEGEHHTGSGADEHAD